MNKKNKTLLYLVILSILIIITGIALSLNKKTTLSLKNTQFAYTDTQNVQKVFMADMKGQTVLLVRSKNGWLVNNKYEANEERIDLLLETIASIKVKNPVPITTHDFVIRNLATSSIKVEIYTTKKKPVKVYYVGGATPDYFGTYMLLESKNKVPYVVYKPGLNGYLSEGYYYTDENEWRTRVIFDADPLNINLVEISYNSEPDSSFVLKAQPDHSFSIEPLLKNNTALIVSDQKRIRRFLLGFTNLQFMELVLFKSRPDFKDSLLRTKPLIKVTLTETGKKSKSLYLYPKPVDSRTKTEKDILFDPRYFYAYIDDRPDQIFLMQDLVLERILWKMNDFKE
jgi:hypothetical protein